MSESSPPRRKRVSRVRERYEARNRRRHEPQASLPLRSALPDSEYVDRAAAIGGRASLMLRDAWWHFRNSPKFMLSVIGLVSLYALVFVGSHVMSARVFPNVWSMGVYLGDQTIDEAEATLLNAWSNDIKIELQDEDRQWTVTPAEMGLRLNARPMAEAARNVGMAGMPLGWGIEPVIEVEQGLAQEFLLNLSLEAEIRPVNASYALENGEMVGLVGSDGRRMDVSLALERLNQNVVNIVQQRHMDLIMTVISPEVTDPEPYLEDARALVNNPFQMVGYDPYTNDYITWQTTPDTFASWLEAGANGLTLNDQNFAPFLEAQNASLEGDEVRYLDNNETMDKVRQAIAEKTRQVNLRVRYRPTQYEVAYGDRAYGIARKTGIPYFLLEEANAGRDLNTLTPGDVLNVPSRDVTMPFDPVPNKRIVIDLGQQSLVAYENDQEVFRWLISSGMSSAPTSPGIYQVLSHDEVAAGSSFTLCGSQGCGQWQMYWFMGIYEVTPGLMNGFHGAVLLPNGAYLGGGNVGQPYTFGCIMSLNENAELLYQWAELGTVVEIISSEFPPLSDLAQEAFQTPA